MRGTQRGFANETTPSYGITGSFPHYKQIIMPPDQKAKLLAMHRASRANAGIYVAVVLAVYVILLTMLLCRYAKRQRPSGDGTAGTVGGGPLLHQICTQTEPPQPSGFFNFTSTKLICNHGGRGRSICATFCCPTSIQREVSIHEIAEFPLSTLTTKIECPRPSTSGCSSTASCRNGCNVESKPKPKLIPNKPIAV